ncbi:putative endonuclease III [Tieghemostelium lacteum]|uniref:Endonuclease III homolog n=1 Tax=Tieghemostelium lacteum TaxID=361077 RepID=A0A152A1H5_TIELA|nr:putative endonuclease III [Tieghemostelium lacteum]|eukprot:KYR00049.1 putative endonuclease III [Tieghemostelium lacteum]
MNSYRSVYYLLRMSQGEPIIKSRFFTSQQSKKSPITIEYEDEPSEKFTKLSSTTTTTTTTNTLDESKKINSSGTKRKIEDTKKKFESMSLARTEWEDVWKKIEKQRKETEAPVDVMGAESFDDHKFEDKERRFHVLVGCLLSSQTKDQITHAAMKKLIDYGLNVDNILKTSESKIEELLHPVLYYKRKAIYLKKISQILKDKYDSDVPSTYEELMALPGIGPKMTLLILNIAWKKLVGIAVDTHMHRISNRLGWVNTTQPEETRKSLESWLPKDRWDQVNLLLVGFGQTICLPQKPKCLACSVNNQCPTGIKNLNSNDNEKEEEEEEEEKEKKKKSSKKIKSSNK